MLERDIEAYLVEQVKKLGGRAFKFVSPGNSGVPDRLVCLPGGVIAFVEMKAPGGKSTALQTRQQSVLRGLGNWVEVLDSKDDVNVFISVCKIKLRGRGFDI